MSDHPISSTWEYTLAVSICASNGVRCHDRHGEGHF